MLFVVTFLTTTTVGGVWAIASRPDLVDPSEGKELWGIASVFDPAVVRAVWNEPEVLGWGLRFSITVLFILLCHELGHWFACRRHRLPATPPYFLPAPVGIGTFGAFIRIRAPIRRKRVLLEVGVAGPIAGFVALLPVLWKGLADVQAAPIESAGAAAPGVGSLELGGNLLLLLAERVVDLPAHGEAGLLLNPFLLAAWVGMFATMLNLLPLAQLDGGHVLYAATGRLHRILAWPIWGALALLGLAWSGWWFWCVVVLVLGLRHPSVADERSALAGRDRWLVVAALAIFALCFMPVPLRLVELLPG